MRDHDFSWLTEHSSELQQEYAGKWIAVRDGKVIGVGDTATAATKRAHDAFGDADFILEAIDAKTDVIYGCL